LPSGNDFLETLPVALVELKGFVEPILEVKTDDHLGILAEIFRK
jgi:hypothetical protein